MSRIIRPKAPGGWRSPRRSAHFGRRRSARQRVLDCGGKRSAPPLSPARKSFASRILPVRPKAPSPLPLCRRTHKERRPSTSGGTPDATERGLSPIRSAAARPAGFKIIPAVSPHSIRCELGQLALRPAFVPTRSSFDRAVALECSGGAGGFGRAAAGTAALRGHRNGITATGGGQKTTVGAGVSNFYTELAVLAVLVAFCPSGGSGKRLFPEGKRVCPQVNCVYPANDRVHLPGKRLQAAAKPVQQPRNHVCPARNHVCPATKRAWPASHGDHYDAFRSLAGRACPDSAGQRAGKEPPGQKPDGAKLKGFAPWSVFNLRPLLSYFGA